MRSKVYIVTNIRSKAALYTYDFVFHTFFGVDFELIQELSQAPSGAPVIHYNSNDQEGRLSIPSISYLENDSLLDAPEIEIGEWDNLPIYFQKEGSVPFDMFGACFYLLTRVEEYNTSARDQHGRFEFKNSLMSHMAFRRKPIIDLWLVKFGNEISERFESFQPEKRSFTWLNTFDIDIAFAYSNRSPMRVIAATGKNILNGNFKAVKERIGVLAGGKNDPFDTYEFQEKLARRSAVQTTYFFLLGNGGRMDRNISIKQSGFVSLIKHIRSYANVGIHPSYLSGDKHTELHAEIGKLDQITGVPTKHSRQHFLRMRLPETYNRLIDQGISHDYSMGFAEAVGFRSGTCTEHRFFDLNQNSTTILTVRPLTIMEGTLRDYLKMDPVQAMGEIKALVDVVKEVEGTFISLWHNDSLEESDANPWRKVYSDMVMYIESKFPNKD